jgi:hypothetical protein
MKGLTPARRRVLLKTAQHGYIMRPGSLSGEAQPRLWCEDGFDRPSLIDRLIAMKLLGPGAGAGQYALTDMGRAVSLRLQAKRAAA